MPCILLTLFLIVSILLTLDRWFVRPFFIPPQVKCRP